MSTNPFKEAEERKRKEAEARKRKEDEERKKQEETVKAAEEAAKAAKEIKVAEVPEQETAPIVVPPLDPVRDAASLAKEQIDATGAPERKVSCNIMIPPSLKKRMERDVNDRRFKSMSALITSLLQAYYNE